MKSDKLQFGLLLAAAVVLTLLVGSFPLGIALFVYAIRKYRSQPNLKAGRRSLMVIASCVMGVIIVGGMVLFVIIVKAFEG